jgi:hypothetical protein
VGSHGASIPSFLLPAGGQLPPSNPTLMPRRFRFFSLFRRSHSGCSTSGLNRTDSPMAHMAPVSEASQGGTVDLEVCKTGE